MKLRFKGFSNLKVLYFLKYKYKNSLEYMCLNEQFFEYLIEKRCLACYPYFSTLEKIVEYTKNFIKNNKSENDIWKFEVPLSITQEICIFNELHIYIEVENIFNYVHKEDIGYASSIVEPYTQKQIKNGVFYRPEFINVHCYAENSELYEHTLYANLSHELNHKIEQIYQDINKHKINGVDPIFMQSACYEILKDIHFSNDKFKDNYIHMITYRLFEQTELQALVFQVAPELLAMHCTNKNDIQRTSTYLFFDFMKKHLDILDNLTNDEWKNIYNNINMLTIWPKEQDINEFKKDFKKKTINCLNKLERKINQAASLYFDGSLNRAFNEKLNIGQIEIH